MIREIDENQIRQDKLLKSSDMAKVGCNECEGCCECCKNRQTVIVLDEIDVRMLKEGLGYTFKELLEAGFVSLTVVDGVVLPHLCVKKDSDECVFLDENGRCRIHDIRPGICRMFPLARIYNDDDTFSYFIQEGECPKKNPVKTKISKWLGYRNIKDYEAKVMKYHRELKALKELCSNASSNDEVTKYQMKFLEEHFLIINGEVL